MGHGNKYQYRNWQCHTEWTGPLRRLCADGTFFITAGNGDLYTINLITGAPTFVGTITANGSQLTTSTGDMAFAPDGRLYLDTEGLLYRIDTTSLDATYLEAMARWAKFKSPSAPMNCFTAWPIAETCTTSISPTAPQR